MLVRLPGTVRNATLLRMWAPYLRRVVRASGSAGQKNKMPHLLSGGVPTAGREHALAPSIDPNAQQAEARNLKTLMFEKVGEMTMEVVGFSFVHPAAVAQEVARSCHNMIFVGYGGGPKHIKNILAALQPAWSLPPLVPCLEPREQPVSLQDTIVFWSDGGPHYRSTPALSNVERYITERFRVHSQAKFGEAHHLKGQVDGLFGRLTAFKKHLLRLKRAKLKRAIRILKRAKKERAGEKAAAAPSTPPRAQ